MLKIGGPKIVFLNIWFGPLPEYFPFFVQSCEYVSNRFKWIIYTDQVSTKTKLTARIEAIPYSWEMLIKDFKKINVHLERPTVFNRSVTKTLGQCRAFLHLLRDDDLPSHTHYGIFDLDVIYGDLFECLYDAEDYLVLPGDPRWGCGPLTIFRNDCDKLLLKFPNIRKELEDNSYDIIETNELLQFFEKHGKVKRKTGLQPFRELVGTYAGYGATWNEGKLVVHGKEGNLKAGFFHFGGQRKASTFKIKTEPCLKWTVDQNGIKAI